MSCAIGPHSRIMRGFEPRAMTDSHADHRPVSRPIAFAMLVFAMACWGGNWVVARAIALEVPSLSMVFWRTLLFASLAYLLARRHLAADWPVLRANWKMLTLLAAIGVTGYASSGYTAVRYTTATNASLLANTTPLFSVLFSWLILRATVSARQMAGAMLALIGAVLIVSRADWRVLAEFQLNPGDLILLVGVVLWALYSVLLQKSAKIRPESLVFAITSIAAVLSVPGLLYEAAQGQYFPVTARAIGGLIYLAVFSSFLAFVCHAKAVPVVTANVATFFSPLVPVFGTLAAVVFLDETLAGYHYAGFACVGVGILLAAKR
jgi:drug/metabolite transporter (DMT)-like permease